MTTRPFEKILSLNDLKDTADYLSNYFFTPGAMKFFNSRVSDEIYPVGDSHGYIVTSEKYGEDAPRHYVVRKYAVAPYTRLEDGRTCDSLSIDMADDSKFYSADGAHSRASELQGYAMIDNDSFEMER